MIDFYVSDGELFDCDDAAIMRKPTGFEVQNAVVAVDNSSRRSFGVFDNAGVLIADTLADGRPVPGKKSYENAVYYDDVAFFCGGDRFFHFGHFLVEGMERAWPLLNKKYKNAKLVFVTSRTELPWYAVEFFRMLGVGAERVILLNRSARFRTMYVPQRAAHIGQYTSDVQNAVYQKIAGNAAGKTAGDKIYLSRGRMGVRSIFGEEQIQRIFEKNGFSVVYPETLSLAEQVSIAAGAKCIAGIAGSALHLCVFMKPGGRVIQLNRAQHRDNAMVQYVLCRGAGADLTLVSASQDTVKQAHFFDDSGFKYSAADTMYNAAAHSAYRRAIKDYYRRRGTVYKIKRFVVKVAACFVPGYKNRHRVRQWLGHKLKMDK